MGMLVSTTRRRGPAAGVSVASISVSSALPGAITTSRTRSGRRQISTRSCTSSSTAGGSGHGTCRRRGRLLCSFSIQRASRPRSAKRDDILGAGRRRLHLHALCHRRSLISPTNPDLECSCSIGTSSLVLFAAGHLGVQRIHRAPPTHRSLRTSRRARPAGPDRRPYIRRWASRASTRPASRHRQAPGDTRAGDGRSPPPDRSPSPGDHGGSRASCGDVRRRLREGQHPWT